jgi:L-seryl-tRNA(Ser) seleniumtransferase
MGETEMNDNDLLRKIPAVDAVLSDERLLAAAQDAPRRVLVDAVRDAVADLRQRVRKGELGDADADALRDAAVCEAVLRVQTAAAPHYRRVVNAAGIILHTGLGRAVLPPAALARVQHELAGYSVLQLDTETGKRSQRDAPIERLLMQLTGAEAATVVNNNAAATMLVLNTVAAGREVIVSRGQLVEIGGSFRLPDVMAASGVRMVEVGTTNRTHVRDYRDAITEDTAALIRVHPSNYQVRGFTAEVSLEEMVDVAHANDLVVIDDLGAGALLDFSRFGFAPEPMLPASVAAGADVVTASADKLIGGPQGGVILGRADILQRIRKNPMARALRVDKVTLAALEATLNLFLDEEVALREVPTLRMLSRRSSEIQEQAERIAAALCDVVEVGTEAGFSRMGSGSLPEQNLPTTLVTITPSDISAGELALRLRRQDIPVFSRVKRERVLLDPRTLLEGDEDILIAAVRASVGDAD